MVVGQPTTNSSSGSNFDVSHFTFNPELDNLSHFVQNLMSCSLISSSGKENSSAFCRYISQIMAPGRGRTIKQNSCHVSRGIQTPDGAPGAGVDPGLTVKKGSRQSNPGLARQQELLSKHLNNSSWVIMPSPTHMGD